jgi:hypothetical protein
MAAALQELQAAYQTLRMPLAALKLRYNNPQSLKLQVPLGTNHKSL